MICETIMTCSLLFGGATYHFSDKYAPESGYTWNNQTIGLAIEQNKEGFYNGINLATFKDSFNKRSFSSTISNGFRFNKQYSAGIAVGYTKTSYHDGIIAVLYNDVCINNYCVTLLGLPDLGIGNDAFVNIGLKVKF